MLSEPSNLPKKHPAPKPKYSSNVTVPAETGKQRQPLPPVIGSWADWADDEDAIPDQPRTQKSQPAISRSSIRRPGCVTATALLFFFAAFLSVLGVAGSIVEFDVVFALGNFIYGVLLTITAVGLWYMYRWAVNVVLMFSVMNILRLLLMPTISLFIIDDYIVNRFERNNILLSWVLIAIVGFAVIGLAGYWFLKTRKWFLDNDIFPGWERNFYIASLTVLIIELILSLATLPDVYQNYSSMR